MSGSDSNPASNPGIKRNSRSKEVWRMLKKNKPAMAGLFILLTFVALAVFADVIADYKDAAITQNMSIRLQPPNRNHIFGTDLFGRDIFARIIHGSRISLSIGILSTLMSLTIGGFIGATTGYYGGKFDSIVMRIMDVFMCIPAILLALAIVSSLGPSMLNLMLAITIAQAPNFARVIRSVILTIATEDYVEAAKACGTSDARIITRHILPNAMGPIIVQGTMAIATNIISASALSFIGMGIQPPTPEWGVMLSEVREYMRYAPYMVIIPGMSIVLTVLSINLLGDGLRDALDPRLKN